MISSDYSYLVPQWIKDETTLMGSFLMNSSLVIDKGSLYKVGKSYGKTDYLLLKSETRIQWSKHYKETVKNYIK